jgi:chromosome segregation ATPase
MPKYDTGHEVIDSVFNNPEQEIEEEQEQVNENTDTKESSGEDNSSSETLAKQPQEEEVREPEEGRKDEEVAEKDESTLSKEEFDKLEKRRRDAESEMSRERDIRKNLEKELEKVNKQLEEINAANKEQQQKMDEKEFANKYRDKIESGQTDDLLEVFNDLRKEIHSNSNAKKNNDVIPDVSFEVQKQLAAQKYDDFWDVWNLVTKAAAADPSIDERWKEKGSTVEAAYEIGKPLLEAQQFIKDPEAFKKRLMEESTNGKNIEKKPKTLSNMTSNKLSNEPKNTDTLNDGIAIVYDVIGKN